MKTIGIILRPFSENQKLFMGTRKDLFDALSCKNVNVLGIPITNNFDNIINVVNMCDGIILSGGDKHIDTDYKLVKYLYQNNIPTLGICLGMQAMGKVFNNYQEIKVSNHYNTNKYSHQITIFKDTKLFNILQKQNIKVNSRHKDAIPSTNLKISAISEDGVIEAIEDTNKKFFIGVEWHPESLDDENSKKLFQEFINVL